MKKPYCEIEHLPESHSSACSLVQSIGYSKVSAEWVAEILRNSTNVYRIASSVWAHEKGNQRTAVLQKWWDERDNSYIAKKNSQEASKSMYIMYICIYALIQRRYTIIKKG